MSRIDDTLGNPGDRGAPEGARYVPSGPPGAPPPPIANWQDMQPPTRGRNPGPSPVRTASYRAGVWGTDGYSDQDAMSVNSRRRPRDSDRESLATRVDFRGVFVAGVSALLLPACFITYYTLQGFTRSGLGVHATFTVVAHAFGAWRVAIPCVAGLCVVLGVVDSLLPVAASGAVSVFVALRLAVVAQLALWVVAAIDRAPTTPPGAPPASVTWLAWAAIGIALVAVLGSLASMAKRTYT